MRSSARCSARPCVAADAASVALVLDRSLRSPDDCARLRAIESSPHPLDLDPGLQRRLGLRKVDVVVESQSR
jgi:hypothetical protein